MQLARYGRLNVSGTVLSKRKIVELVNKGHVRAWDDPRVLYTLIALRRRGIPPGAILSFVNELGVTKATTNIELRRFETSIRRYLELTVPRLMLVLEPLTVVIDGLDDDHLDMVDFPFSKNPAYGVRQLPFTLLIMQVQFYPSWIQMRQTPRANDRRPTAHVATALGRH